MSPRPMNTLSARAIARSPRAAAITVCAFLMGTAAAGTATLAAPLSSVSAAGAPEAAVQGTVEPVRHRKWRGGGIGIIIEPGYGYDYYPRYRSYDYDDYRYYDDDDDVRHYRRHSRKWVRERFEHPLGRR